MRSRKWWRALSSNLNSAAEISEIQKLAFSHPVTGGYRPAVRERKKHCLSCAQSSFVSRRLKRKF